MTTLRGWLSAAHPFPLTMVLLLTALIAVTTTDANPEPRRLALLLLAMLFSQFAIGWSNDYLDRHADAEYQPSKPLPSGLVDPRLMPPAIALVLVASAAAGVALGALPFGLLVIGTACGLAYNLGLKATALSAVPFVVAFTVLPLFVWTALDVFDEALLVLYAVGLTLPVAVHLANVLPDIETDRAQGRSTAVVSLGRSRSIGLTVLCLTWPAAITLLTLVWLDYADGVLAVALAAYGLLSTAAIALYARRDRGAEVWSFRLLVVASIVFAGGWLAAR